MRKTVAISDIHGHYTQLAELMEMLRTRYEIDFNKDILVFLGDYVDGGPNTKEVLDTLILWKKIYPHWHFLYGNHEDMLLTALDKRSAANGMYYHWWSQGGRETLESFKKWEKDEYQKAIMQPADLIRPTYIKFMKELESFYEDENYFFVHGGVYDEISLAKLKEMNEEAPEATRADIIWIREPFISSKFKWEKKIIFGHTVNAKVNNKGEVYVPYPPFELYGPIIYKNKIGIDTFLHNKGKLTAIILPEEEIVQTEFVEDAALI